MRTNLIQAYLNRTPQVQQYNSDKAVKDFDVQKELRTRTFIKPLPSNGKLVKNTIFDIPAEYFKDMKYDMRALKHSINGEANDHELGKLNDMGMKLGGLAIASYLFTRKGTPKTKIFEFIGLLSFFGAMDLWPKLFLQLPAYLLHGFDIRQNYVDNYGRKKMLYQDHQFIPWDLYSDEEINKIGDRMRVPKDIPNRRDFIQEKMRKIALQNNTMWMLTSGFATPIMSALICNALEKPVPKYQGEKLDKSADFLLSNFSQEIKKYDYSKNEAAMTKLLSDNAGKPITKQLVDEIHANLADDLNYVTAQSLRTDIDNLLPTDSFNFTKETLGNIRKVLEKNFENLDIPFTPEEIAQILPDDASIMSTFEEKGLIKTDIKDFSEHTKLIQDLLDSKIESFVAQNPDNLTARRLDFYMKNLVHSNDRNADSELLSVFKSTQATVLSDNTIETIKSISKTLNSLKAKNAVLDEFAFIKTAQAPETILANFWNDIASDEFLKTLNISPDEIKKARLDSDIAGKILRNKFEDIVVDDTRYAQVVEFLQKKLSALQGKMLSLSEFKDGESVSLYKSLVDSTFDNSAASLKAAGMINTAENLVGYDDTIKTSLKELQLSFVTDRIKGVKSSFYRLLNALDLYHRISKVEKVDILHAKMPREVKEELVEMCKQLVINGHNSDYAVKFYFKRNPELNPHFANDEARKEFYSQIETKNGRVVNKYFGKHDASELVELANDREFFDAAIKLMYDGELHPDTIAKIKDSAFLEEFMRYRKDVMNFVGGDQYKFKPNHLPNGQSFKSSSKLRFLLLGSASDELFFKLCKQKFNSMHWFKRFGTIGAGLAVVTLLPQFFFGKMKNPKASKENK